MLLPKGSCVSCFHSWAWFLELAWQCKQNSMDGSDVRNRCVNPATVQCLILPINHFFKVKKDPGRCPLEHEVRRLSFPSPLLLCPMLLPFPKASSMLFLDSSDVKMHDHQCSIPLYHPTWLTSEMSISGCLDGKQTGLLISCLLFILRPSCQS